MNKENQTFSESFKRSLVEQISRGELSKEEARRLHGIKGKSRILEWQRNYQKYGRCSLNLGIDFLLLKASKSTTTDLSKDDLKSRVRELERQLEDEQLRSEAYRRVIDFAEQDLNIPLRKKLNTK